MVRLRDPELREVVNQYVPVRLLNMKDVDIGLFKFDYDLTWAAVMMNANDQIYSRYGRRDARSADGRLSIAGLNYTLRQVLQHHRSQRSLTAPSRQPIYPDDLFPTRGKCLHCHQVYEGLRKQARRDGRFDPESLYVYPLPENVGLQLDMTVGNKVVGVTPNSPAQRAGLQVGDVLDSVRNIRTFSQADVMWALHNAPTEGKVVVEFTRAGRSQSALPALGHDWKKTDLSWRPSMRREKDFLR